MSSVRRWLCAVDSIVVLDLRGVQAVVQGRQDENAMWDGTHCTQCCFLLQVALDIKVCKDLVTSSDSKLRSL